MSNVVFIRRDSDCSKYEASKQNLYYDVNHQSVLSSYDVCHRSRDVLADAGSIFADSEIVNPKNRGTQEVHRGSLHHIVLTSRRTSMHV